MSYDETKLELFDVLVPKDGLVFQDCRQHDLMEIRGVTGGRLYCYWLNDANRHRHVDVQSGHHYVSMSLLEWWRGLSAGELVIL